MHVSSNIIEKKIGFCLWLNIVTNFGCEGLADPGMKCRNVNCN